MRVGVYMRRYGFVCLPSLHNSRTHISISVCVCVCMLVLFQLYDEDDDGFISRNDLLTTLQLMTTDQITEEQLKEFVDKTFGELTGVPPKGMTYMMFRQVRVTVRTSL